ncbi:MULTISPECIES: SDR family oxidoreductase [unclassified Streptomyces]|uniref:SDR family oxidoreductase n=1 Tax=unclassified Streptomyces TaxID=2593676 RepID=UPI001909B9FE|nr:MULTISPECIES: SDR family oxidoreductase [unclassified Streptomyces]MBK3566964.1 SDR family oxidoreductase [Streptomyces sp. MBT62]MBK6014413.1 SDR family oxidoreductase [Streptomyces sp. MBT53]
MRVFVTGATGFVGGAVVRELLDSGHQVLGLARSDTSAEQLAATGAEVHRGSLEDLDALRAGASAADGVIHTGFIHDFSNYGPCVATDLAAVETLIDTLAGSDRPLVITSVMSHGRTEDEVPDLATHPEMPRLAAELTTLAAADRGVRTSVIRLPQVHGEGDHAFVPALIDIARAKGVSAYVGAGTNLWAAVHREDAALLYRLALENAPAGSVLHAIGDEGIPVREIAEVIGKRLDLPVTSVPAEEAGTHFGWLGHFVASDLTGTSTLTQKRFGWTPTRIGLLADLDHDYYFNQPS